MHIRFYYTQTLITSSKINIYQNRAYIPLPHTPCELLVEFDCNQSDNHCAKCTHPFPPFFIFQRGVVSKTSKPFILKNFIKNKYFSKASIFTSSSRPIYLSTTFIFTIPLFSTEHARVQNRTGLSGGSGGWDSF